jgi:uncharacterized protein DUF488
MLFTIGHSTRTATSSSWRCARGRSRRSSTFARPARSRTNPQFDRARLTRRLPAKSIAYVAMAELGGRRRRAKTADPERNGGWRVAAFHNYADYAETAPRPCGGDVTGASSPTKAERATRTPFARSIAGRRRCAIRLLEIDELDPA